MDTFDLEMNILQFGNYADQIRLICRAFLNETEEDILYRQEKLVNALEGLAVLIELQENKTFESYKKTFKLDEYCLK